MPSKTLPVESMRTSAEKRTMKLVLIVFIDLCESSGVGLNRFLRGDGLASGLRVNFRGFFHKLK